MARWRKQLAKMRECSKGWRYKQLASILRRHGFKLLPHGGGSHRLFEHPSGRYVGLVDTGKGFLKPVYVEEALEAIDDVTGGTP